MKRFILALLLVLATVLPAGAQQGVLGLTTNGQVLTVRTVGQGGLGVSVQGAWTGTLVVEATIDDVNFFSISIVPVAGGAAISTISSGTTGAWQTSITGLSQVRVRSTAAMTGTATVGLVGAGSSAVSAASLASTQTTTANQGTAASGANIWPTASNQGAALLNTTATSAATTAQTLTCAGAAGTRVTLRYIALYASTATQNITLVVQDGGVTKLDLGTVVLTTALQVTVFPNVTVTAATAASLTVVIGAAAAGTTTGSAICDRS